MNLCLLGHDQILVDRWDKVLAEKRPKQLKNLEAFDDEGSILIVSDKIVLSADPVQLDRLFRSRVMIMSMTPSFADAQKFLQMGAMGYGNAMMHEYHLHSVVQALEEGKIWLHPDFITLMIAQVREAVTAHQRSEALLETLSKREQEVALMLGNGATHQEIADALDITVRTVKAHATAIYQKLDVKDRLALSLLLHT